MSNDGPFLFGLSARRVYIVVGLFAQVFKLCRCDGEMTMPSQPTPGTSGPRDPGLGIVSLSYHQDWAGPRTWGAQLA